jgi:hypothetical protein
MKQNFDTTMALNILNAAMNGKRHANYDRTCELAKFYKSVFTDKGLEQYITAYKPREDDEQKKQRIAITKLAINAACKRAMRPFDEVTRVENITSVLSFANDAKKEKEGQVYERLNVFYGSDSLKTWLNSRMKHYQMFDPNAFCITEYMMQDGKVWSYPLEVKSSQVVDLQYFNGDLQYLIAGLESTTNIEDGTAVTVSKYTLYAPKIIVVLEEIPEKWDKVLKEGYTLISLPDSAKKEKLYQYRSIETTITEIPCISFGYILDAETDLQSYVSPIEDCRTIILDLINAKSEYDLSLCLHGFYKKYMYVEACDNKDDNNRQCNGGKIAGQTCNVCKGSGTRAISTSQEFIAYKMPKPEEVDSYKLPSISDMVHYEPLDLGLMDMQKNRVEALKNEIFLTIFNTNLFERAQFSATATEKRIELNSIYNVLSDFANKYSAIYKHCVSITAQYLGLHDLTVTHAFPKDFKLESLPDLLAQRELAQRSGSGTAIMKGIDAKILDKIFQDAPFEKQKATIQESFRPFISFSETEKIAVVAMLPEKDSQRILYLNFDPIFSDIEIANPLFYALNRAQQRNIINQEIEKISSKIILTIQ